MQLMVPMLGVGCEAVVALAFYESIADVREHRVAGILALRCHCAWCQPAAPLRPVVAVADQYAIKSCRL